MTDDELEQTKERDVKLVKTAIGNLMEHFDTVQIFCTRHISPEHGTLNLKLGAGNWFARFGQVSMWVSSEETEDADSEDE
jgi:hypothetical protein